ncbi:hypothetical protein HC761_02230, partial [bacterium]|nr:hypothetical protein [bacterium]
MITKIATPGSYTLVRDLSEGIGNSDPRLFRDLNGKTFFQAFKSAEGYLSNVIPSPGAAPQSLGANGENSFFDGPIVKSGGLLYFRGSPEELWVSDGTLAGTQMIFDTGTFGPSGFRPINEIAATSQGVVFVAETRDIDGDGSGESEEIWVSNGTASGTVRFANTLPSSFNFTPLYNALAGASEAQRGNMVVFGDFVP